MTFTDALGQAHAPVDTTPRIASLVPSITDLLFSLDLGGQLVARTGFCIHPREAVRAIPKVGGTKTVKLDRLRELAPTHVIVNIDENTRETADKLREFVPHVIVTHPCAPEDNLTLYGLLGGIFRREAQAQRLSEALARELAALRGQVFPLRRVLYAIWQDPWMTVARDTYISRMLALIGCQTWPEDRRRCNAARAGTATAPAPTGPIRAIPRSAGATRWCATSTACCCPPSPTASPRPMRTRWRSRSASRSTSWMARWCRGTAAGRSKGCATWGGWRTSCAEAGTHMQRC